MSDDLPPELMNQAKACFEKYDLNKNDLIEPDELKLLMTDVANEIGIPIPSDENVNKVLDDTDINGDKKISREEFLTLFKIIYVMKSMKDN